ncbi:MAG: hypothetical protein GC159_00760 [Phycisphaera sp.]|nr:hypothetical protein [Phycisphaera sp.]
MELNTLNGLSVCHPRTPTDKLPPLLRADRQATIHESLVQAYPPQGPIEHLLIRQLAGCAALLELSDQAILAAQQQGALEVLRLLDNATSDHETRYLLAGTLNSAAVDRGITQTQKHTRRFMALLDRLLDLQARRRADKGARLDEAIARFRNDQQCRDYLIQRRFDGRCPCSSCGSIGGAWIDTRRCWQCRCGRQAGLLADTVAARSQLPLLCWFRAIAVVLIRPTTTTAEMAKLSGIERPATASDVNKRIRDALLHGDATRLLMDLDRVFLGTPLDSD